MRLQSVCPGTDIQHAPLPTSPLVVGIVLRSLGAPLAARAGRLPVAAGAREPLIAPAGAIELLPTRWYMAAKKGEKQKAECVTHSDIKFHVPQ